MATGREPFGVTENAVPVERVVLESATGSRAVVMTRGASLCEMLVPDRDGVLGDVTLGFDTLAGYEQSAGYIGCVVGRVANRIAGSGFELDGRHYALTPNEGANHLHGGRCGLDRAVYAIREVADTPPRVVLETRSPDGDQGYPGRLLVRVGYTLDGSDLRIDLEAHTDRRTPLNLTHHGYWNLATPAAGDVLGHRLESPAGRYLESDAERIPTGAVLPVDGTALDFRRDAGLRPGCDAHLVLGDRPTPAPRFAARLRDPGSGRVMEVHTTQPGFQLYTGDHLDAASGKAGVRYGAHRGVCLEPQHPPDAVHHAHFPSVVLSPGEVYRQTILLRFSAA